MKSTVETKHHDRDTAVLNADRLRRDKNVGPLERAVCCFLGGSLIGLAAWQRSLRTGLVVGLVGGPLLLRGITGRSALYHLLGIDTAGLTWDRSGKSNLHGINVVKSVIVNRSVEECYSYWFDFEKFPTFMEHLESVAITGDKTSRWVACGPLGTTVEWDAEIVKSEENKLIEWR